MTLGSQICLVRFSCQELFPFSSGFFSGLAQAVALPVGFDDVATMGEAIKQGPWAEWRKAKGVTQIENLKSYDTLLRC